MKADERRLKIVAATAREYRRVIKEIAPTIRIHVGNPEDLVPITAAAQKLDDALKALG